MKDDRLPSEQTRGSWRLIPRLFWTSQDYAIPGHVYIVEVDPATISEGGSVEPEPIGLSVDRTGDTIELLDGGTTMKQRTENPKESMFHSSLGHFLNKVNRDRARYNRRIRSLSIIVVAASFACSGFFFRGAIVYYFRLFTALSLTQSIPVLMLIGVIFLVLFQAAMAVSEGFKSGAIVRVKVGNGFFDFDPNMSDEELRYRIEEAASK